MDSRTYLVGVLAGAVGGCALPTAIGELPEQPTSTSTSGPTSTTTPPTSTSGSATETTGGMVGPGPMRAFAMRFDELPGPGDSSASDVAVGSSGGPFSPDAIVVTITTGVDTCDDPFAPLQCGIAWNVSFNIPPELQMPGSYDLSPGLNGFASSTGELRPEGDCSFGGGTLSGTLVLDEIDETHVAGRLENTDAFEFDADVTFDAPRCFL